MMSHSELYIRFVKALSCRHSPRCFQPQLLGTSVVSPEAGAWSGCTCSGGHPKAIVSDLEKSILSLNSCAGNSVVMVSPWQVMLILLGWWSFKFPFLKNGVILKEKY